MYLLDLFSELGWTVDAPGEPWVSTFVIRFSYAVVWYLVFCLIGDFLAKFKLCGKFQQIISSQLPSVILKVCRSCVMRAFFCYSEFTSATTNSSFAWNAPDFFETAGPNPNPTTLPELCVTTKPKQEDVPKSSLSLQWNHFTSQADLVCQQTWNISTCNQMWSKLFTLTHVRWPWALTLLPSNTFHLLQEDPSAS